MLKKAGIVVAASAAGLLALSPAAFAVDIPIIGDLPILGDGALLNVSDVAVQLPIQACNNSVIEGTLGVLAKDLSNEDSHDGDCKQKNVAEDNRGNGDDSDADDDSDGDDDNSGDDDGDDDGDVPTSIPTTTPSLPIPGI